MINNPGIYKSEDDTDEAPLLHALQSSLLRDKLRKIDDLSSSRRLRLVAERRAWEDKANEEEQEEDEERISRVM